MADRATKVGISDPLDLVDPTPVSPHYEFDADGLPVTGFFRAGLGLWNGTTYDRARGDTTSGLWVNIKNLGQQLEAASVPVVLTAAQLATLTPYAPITNYALEAGGNLATAVASLSVLDDWDESDRAKVNPIAGQAGVQGGAGAVTALTQRVVLATDQSSIPVAGDVAHDGADSGNPVKIGSVAVSGSATPASVAAGDRTRHIANQHGIPYVIAGHPNLITREYDFGTSAQTDVNLAAAAVAADERIYITRLEVMCDKANTVNVSVRVGFGTSTVPAASSSGVSGMIGSHPGIAPGSGFISGNGSGVIAVGGAGEEPRITSSAATTGNLHVIISYFLIDETP